MSVQQQTDISSHPYIVDGTPKTRRVTVAQDAGRSGNMVKGTVMAYNPTSAKWEPWTDETATDGTAHPKGILLDLLTEAAIQAGDIANVSMIIGGDVVLNEDLITFENSLTKNTVINVPTNLNKAAWQLLNDSGIHFMDTQEGTSYEA